MPDLTSLDTETVQLVLGTYGVTMLLVWLALRIDGWRERINARRRAARQIKRLQEHREKRVYDGWNETQRQRGVR